MLGEVGINDSDFVDVSDESAGMEVEEPKLKTKKIKKVKLTKARKQDLKKRDRKRRKDFANIVKDRKMMTE